MKIQAHKVSNFLAAIPPDIKGFLFYGPEQGLVAEYGDMLAQNLVENPKDPFSSSYVDMSQLVSGEVVLEMELNEISMFSSQKLIRIRHADEKLEKYLQNCEALLETSQNFLVIEAGDLGPNSKLRKFCEAHKAVAALPCYVEAHRQLVQLIIDILRTYDLQAERGAIEYLAIHLASNRVMLRAELEKIALFKLGALGPLTLEEVQQILAHSADIYAEIPIWEMMAGRMDAVEAGITTLVAQGVSEVALVRSALKHIYRLMLCRSEMEKGKLAQDVLSLLKPPVFYKQKTLFCEQLNRYPLKYLARIFNRLLQLEFELKQTHVPMTSLMMYQFNQITAFNKRV